MFIILHAALVVQAVKSLLAMQETPVQPLGQEDPREKGLTTHSNILTWEIPRTGGPGGLQNTGSQRVRHDGATISLLFHAFKISTLVSKISSIRNLKHDVT